MTLLKALDGSSGNGQQQLQQQGGGEGQELLELVLKALVPSALTRAVVRCVRAWVVVLCLSACCVRACTCMCVYKMVCDTRDDGHQLHSPPMKSIGRSFIHPSDDLLDMDVGREQAEAYAGLWREVCHTHDRGLIVCMYGYT